MTATTATTAAARRRAASEQGMSLLETLIGAALLLVLAVGLLPVLTTAQQANVGGHDASVASYEARSWVDTLLTWNLEAPIFDLTAPPPGSTVRAATSGAGGEEMVMPTDLWDTGARTPSGNPPRLGDADWVAAATGQGLVLWTRSSVFRDYAYADISSGVVDASTGNSLATLGHPDLFDSPLVVAEPASQRQFKETDASLASQRGGDALGVGRFRTRFFRTF